MGVTAKGRRFCDAHVYSSAAGALTRGATCKLPPKVKVGGKDLCRVHDPKAVAGRVQKRSVKLGKWLAETRRAFRANQREQRRRDRLDRLLPAVIEALSRRGGRPELLNELRRCLP